ncbi:RNA polymerase sigma factor SigM [Peterkaempfera griseoplana]|uniref:RNA polymerase sigma factor SigM n=1 Tax=Peterkaempfera griseoplana TaxID=66896 RepID=UPI00099EFDAE|nr:RNA polymerase sigma factor SigM [Peterkaempfera griseoplana]
MEGSEPSTDAALSLSDAELLARHVGGDADAFGELVRRHRDRLWAVALRTLGDREEAADALQDALVSAFRSAHTFQGRSAVTTWLHRIVVNACLDRARRSASRRTTPLEEEGRGFDALLGTDEAADAPVVRSELRHELAAALAALPAEQRSALVLVDMQAYPVAEAAEMLGVPVGTVKSRCARGRARLLPMLKHLRAAQGDGPPAVSRETVLDVSRETSPQPKAPLQDTRRRAGSGNLPAGGTVPGRSPALPTGDMAGEMTAEGGAAPA